MTLGNKIYVRHLLRTFREVNSGLYQYAIYYATLCNICWKNTQSTEYTEAIKWWSEYSAVEEKLVRTVAEYLRTQGYSVDDDCSGSIDGGEIAVVILNALLGGWD